MEACPQCGRVYGKRKRCYHCHGRPRTGEMRRCLRCGKEFYAAAWQIADVEHNQGAYCSRACKYAALSERLAVPKVEGPRRHASGYILVWAPDHPRASHGRVLEHILVAERMLGRLLLPDERVHHKDHNRANNDPANLEVLTKSAHSALHAAEQQPKWQAQRVPLTCPQCGQEFTASPARGKATDPRDQRVYCSQACRLDALHRAAAAYHQRNRDAKAAQS